MWGCVVVTQRRGTVKAYLVCWINKYTPSLTNKITSSNMKDRAKVLDLRTLQCL